ncbi:MAG: crossover junction endodeoxyribonuclease RuvC [Candidatus Nanopelagicales bacterium]
MRVIGIDPGLTRCGIAVVDAAPGKGGVLVHLEVATTDSEQDPAQRLLEISNRIEFVMDKFKPAALSLERVFAQQNLRTVMGVAQVGGLALLAAERRSIPSFTYTPTAVKAAVTGSGRSDKRQVGKMVQALLNLDQIPKPADAADAIALALCHAWRMHDAQPSPTPFAARRVPKVKRND